MATRQAGTLITTHDATYQPPALLPGYGGHVPEIRNEYGQTYGHLTQKYFQDYRSATLNKSSGSYSKGGYFPTMYTHDPHLVIGCRQQDRNRFLILPKCDPSTTDRTRDITLNKYADAVSRHRDYYLDRTGEAKRALEFVIPNQYGGDPKTHCCQSACPK